MQDGKKVFTLSSCDRIEFERDMEGFLKEGCKILSTCCAVVGSEQEGFEVMYGAIVVKCSEKGEGDERF